MIRSFTLSLGLALVLPVVLVTGQPILNGEIDQEEFLYEIRYGWIKIGEAKLSHHRENSTISVDVLAYTTGIVNWIARLKDSIHTVIDAQTLKPIRSFMDRREGKYQRKQEDWFDFSTDSVAVSVYKSKSGSQVETENQKFFLRDSTFDMLSSYLYLRSKPWDRYTPEDSVMLNMFYEDEYYPFGVEYVGEEEITTVLGRHLCHKAYILFPISGTFPEKYMVKVWVTTDKRRLPLMIEAKMKFGKAVCELINVN